MSNRRDFLRSSLSILGLATTAIVPALSKNAFAVQDNNNELIKQTHFAMGTLVTFSVSHNSREEAYEAIAHAMLEIQRLEKIFSRHDKNSALSILNAKGSLKDAPQELVYVLDNSMLISKNTNEVYNPAVKPLLDLFEANSNATNVAEEIAKSDVDHAKNLSNLSNVAINNNSIILKNEGMGITLDSLAKGFIVDRASDVLAKRNVTNHIINAGGDIIAKGRKSANQAWIVGIEDPKNPNQLLTSFEMENQALATSGSYQKFFDKDAKRHHIIDPSSAQSPSMLTISCKAENAMLADAYATACAVAPKSQYSKFSV